MMPGGIIVGYVSDLYGGRRACVISTFMFILVPLLLFFSKYADTMSPTVLLIVLGIMGVLVGGPNNIITSAVAADLADHPSISGNQKVLGTVTGIINGSGSIVAALGLLIIGPLQTTYGWEYVWNFLAMCVCIGTFLLSPTIYKELRGDTTESNNSNSNNSNITRDIELKTKIAINQNSMKSNNV